jgi:hypothetical protein
MILRPRSDKERVTASEAASEAIFQQQADKTRCFRVGPLRASDRAPLRRLPGLKPGPRGILQETLLAKHRKVMGFAERDVMPAQKGF